MIRKIVLDTNVIISALAYGGKPQIIFETINLSKTFEAYTSKKALDELLKVLKQKFKYTKEALQVVEANIRGNFVFIRTGKIPNIITADPADNQFLAIAECAKADFIISGDRHLLDLKKYKSTKIITPTKFIEEVLE